jgi:hypothetical protein
MPNLKVNRLQIRVSYEFFIRILAQSLLRKTSMSKLCREILERGVKGMENE